MFSCWSLLGNNYADVTEIYVIPPTAQINCQFSSPCYLQYARRSYTVAAVATMATIAIVAIVAAVHTIASVASAASDVASKAP